MAIVKFDPTRNFLSWPNWIEDFDEFSSQRGLKVRETDKNIIAEAVVAGIPSDNVEVNIENGILTIKGEVKEEKKDEFRSYQYYYTTALSGGKWDKAEADIENGIVKVKIPKEERSRPRKITVKAKGK